MLGKKDVHVSVKDTVTTSQFTAIWASLGLKISAGYVDAIFNKYGQDAHGRMPIMVCCVYLVLCLCCFICMTAGRALCAVNCDLASLNLHGCASVIEGCS